MPDINLSVIAALIVMLLVSLGLHEAVHAFVAHILGDDTAQREGRLTLNPLKHIDAITTVLLPAFLLIVGLPPILAAKPVPFNPALVRYGEYGAAMVGVAGPLTNFVLAAIVALLMNGGIVPAGWMSHAELFVWLNVGIFVFNMIPIPPLDGSRLLYAFAPEPLQELMERLEQYGLMVILVLFLVLIPIIGPVLTNIDQGIVDFLLR